MTAMLMWGMDEVCVVVSAGHVDGTRGAGVVSSAADMLWMRGVGGVWEMWMYSAWVERGERFGFGFCQSYGNRGSVGRVSVCDVVVGSWYGAGTSVWRGGVVLCLLESLFSV